MERTISVLRWAGVACGAILFFGFLFWKPAGKPFSESAKEVLIIKGLDVGFWPQGMANGAALAAFQEQNPGIELRRWTSFRIPGDLDLASELMSFAARTAPDVTFTYVHRLQFFVEQGFLQPLNKYIGEDTNGDGILDDSEVHWKPWLEMPPMFRQMGMRGTTIYALPSGNFFTLMAYRGDLLERAGVKSGAFPKDFESFFEACQRVCALTVTSPPSSRVYALPRNLDSLFLSLLLSAGGDPGQGLILDATGKTLKRFLPEDDPARIAKQLGLRQGGYSIQWSASFNSPEALKVLSAMKRLYWQPWVLNPKTGIPCNLSEEDVSKGTFTCPGTQTEMRINDVPGGLQTGVCRPSRSAQFVGQTDLDLLCDGQLAMMPLQNTSIANLERSISSLSFALPPAFDPEGRPTVIAIPMLFGLNANLEGTTLQAAWDFLAFRCSDAWLTETSRFLIDAGYGEQVSPVDAERLGLPQRMAGLPSSWITANRDALGFARIIPYFSGYQQAETEFLSRTIRALADRPDLNLAQAISGVQAEVDGRILLKRDTPREPWKPFAAGALLIASAVAMVWGIRAVVGRLATRTSARGGKTKSPWKAAFWILILPALLSVAVWSYYPVIRGLMLAFQEYRLDGVVEWIGLLNFMDGVLSARFVQTIMTTVVFIALNVGLGFFAPVILAVFLHEIPRGRYFFRILFFLPSVTSVLVVMLLWQVLYEPTPSGILNQIVQPAVAFLNGLLPQMSQISFPVRFLQDENLALLCVIIPAIWAGMGAGCLIYLAALQSVSSDLYEAADIDGAGFWHKLTKITIPYLKPLLIINLVGAFVGSAQAWGNIFVMTGGGPGLSTQVAALEIWMNAFVFLRFGVATAQAWILGSLLIGFTVWQIRMMQKVDFRRTQNNG